MQVRPDPGPLRPAGDDRDVGISSSACSPPPPACSRRAALIGRVSFERLVDSTAGGVAGPGNETRLYKTTARR